MPHARRLSDRTGEDHQGLSAAGEVRDPRRRPALARRPARRTGAAGKLLPREPAARGRARHAFDRLPGDQLRHLRLSGSDAARIAVRTVAGFLAEEQSITRVVLACFGSDVLEAYRLAVRQTGAG